MPPVISAVIPVFNEQDSLAPFALELSAALNALAVPCEVIWVDDGSRDGSFAALKGLVSGCPGWKALRDRDVTDTRRCVRYDS